MIGLLLCFAIMFLYKTKAQSNSCTSITNCEACYNSASCHWCGITGCQSYWGGVFAGCVYGENCPSSTTPTQCSSTTSCDSCNKIEGCNWCLNSVTNVESCTIEGQSECIVSNPCPGETPSGGGTSCSSFTDCNSCSNVVGCHMCTDNTCHTYGSYYGCLIGISCNATSPTTCSGYSSCKTCNNAYGCHFCDSDKKCHSIGSPFGCISGMQCEEVEQCVRTSPDFYAYGDLSFGYKVAALFVGICFMVCVWCSYTFCSAFLTINNTDNEIEKLLSNDKDSSHYVEMNQVSISTAINRSANDTPPLASLTAPSSSFIVDTEVQKSQSRKSTLSAVQQSNDYTRRKERALKLCQCVTFIAFISIIALTLSTLFAPTLPPQIYICNKKFDYDSIFDNLANFKAKGNVDILISVYNPNHFGLVLSNASSTFFFNNRQFGTWNLPSLFEIPGGSINDFVLSAVFAPSISDSWSLISAYESQKMVIRIDTTLQASINIGAISSPVVTATDSQEMDIFQPAERELCKCKDFA